MTGLTHILTHKIVAIIRGVKPGDVMLVAKALYEGGVRTLEITLNSQNALAVIEEVSGSMGNKMLIGAGTVLDAESAKAAISVGATFIISPIVDVKTIELTKKHGVVSIPGAYTPTEIVTAYTVGGDIIKVFPASSPGYIKDVRGPLNHIPLMPTGGITADNLQDFYNAGGVAFGIGSSLVDSKQEVTEEYLQQLTVKARRFVEALQEK